MAITKFKNRKKEIKILSELYNQKRPKLIILYGKRRVGKTELLNEFSKKHKALYFVARQESSKDQLKKMSQEAANFFHDDFLIKNPFQNYDALFLYLSKKDVPILFDEFPFLVESNKSVPSILQEYWDKSFSKKDSFLILCGSSIRMMESLLGYKSPLYGRRTEQILLEPLKFRDACEFFPELSAEEKVKNYAVLGGTPAYLLEFNYKKPLLENIQKRILQKSNFLYQDVLFVLKEELNEPKIYYSIIKSIAKGNTKLGNIVNDTGIKKDVVGKYISVLQDLHLVERKIPITEKKSRNGLYILKDNYFKFWFKFVFENKEYIEQNKQENLIKEKIKPRLNAFIGRVYEDIALEWVKEQKEYGEFIFGKWWDRFDEVDIVGINKNKGIGLFGEVKWKEMNQGEVKKEIQKLKEKAQKIDCKHKKFIFVAKKIKNKQELIKEGYCVFDLQDIIC